MERVIPGTATRDKGPDRRGDAAQRDPAHHPVPGDLALPRHCPATSDPDSGGRPPFLVLEVTSWSVGQGRPVAQLTLLDPATGRTISGCPAHLWRRL